MARHSLILRLFNKQSGFNRGIRCQLVFNDLMRADMKKGIEQLTGFIFIAVEEFGVFKMVGILLVLNNEVGQFLVFFGQLIRLARIS